MEAPRHILLSRTDSIGDVMLTLPMAGLLKQSFPNTRITFLGRGYTLPVLRHCRHIDAVMTLEELAEGGDPAAVERMRALRADTVIHVFPHREVARWAKRAGIPLRIGTSHRTWHWTTCNARVPFSRRRSDLHEAQLNTKLLAPLGMTSVPTLQELAALTGFDVPAPDAHVQGLLRRDRVPVILHPGSRGSAVEWGLANFSALMHLLDPRRYQVFVTGTASEREGYAPLLPLDLPHVTDMGGRLGLEQLVQLIGASRALVAASTGPLHIASAAGIRAIGLYAPRRPIHPGRWAPIGRDAHALVADGACARCAQGEVCDCITRIAPAHVAALIDALN